jgi:hypothetical protein
LDRLPQLGPGELSSYAGHVDRELDVREPDIEWAKTSFAVGECYRNLIPYASSLKLPSGLLAAEVMRSRAKEMFEVAREVFLSQGCEIDAARCLQAMTVCDEHARSPIQEGGTEGACGVSYR